VLCHGRQDVNGELVGVGIIDGDKFNARIHQRCDESEIVGQAIQLGDNQLGPLPLADRQSLLEFGPLVALTALDLGELADQRPSATIQVVVDSLVLRLEAKAGFPLLVSGDSVIGDEPAPMRRHTVLPRWRKDTPRPAVDRHHHAGRQADVSGLRCLAEFERSMIRQRVHAGLKRAVAQGKQLGRPKVDPAIEKRIQAQLRSGKGIRKVARECGVGTGTVQRVKQEMAGSFAGALA
jgi:hypothetical protein